MDFFTSDTHFGHANIIKYCNRPFKSVEEMDETLISNWNSVATKRDTVFHLGDFCMRNFEIYKQRLNGNVWLIQGNHDQQMLRWAKQNGYTIPQRLTIKRNGISITLSHFAMRVWPKSHFNHWHLFGHSHGCLEPQGKSFDVGVDSWGYRPVSLEQVNEAMILCDDNFNWVERMPGYDEKEFEDEQSKA